MRCRYCREEIQDRASKCKECGELLGSRRRLRSLSGLFRGFVGVLVPVASLGLAYVEHQARRQADRAKEAAQIAEAEAIQEKEAAQIDREVTEQLLQTVPQDTLAEATLSAVQHDLKHVGAAVLRDDQSRRKAMELRKLSAAESEARERGDTNAAERFRLQAEELETAIIEAQDIPNEDVFKSLGFLSIQAGKPQKAVKRFEEALEKNPLDVEARKGLIYSRTLARAKER